MRTFALFTIALLATSAFAQQDKRGLVDGLPIVGDLLGGNGLLGGNNGGLPIVGDLLSGGNNGLLGLPIGNLLGGLPLGSLLNGLPLNNLLGGGSILDNLLGQQLLGSVLGGILGNKGVAVAASYSSSTFVHANVAANIAIDVPTQAGLLTPITGLLGSILPISSIVPGVLGSTTVLNVRSTVDVQVTVGVVANVAVTLPAGCTPIFTSNKIYAAAQVGIKIDLSANVAADASLITPVLSYNGNGAIGLLKVVGDKLIQVPSFWDQANGRVVANLQSSAIAGTYIFVNIQASV